MYTGFLEMMDITAPTIQLASIMMSAIVWLPVAFIMAPKGRPERAGGAGNLDQLEGSGGQVLLVFAPPFTINSSMLYCTP